ncbi:TIGR00266 family protein [Ruania rhizosphaerae]|uniref:TIGR00266 family protein n=1 Tax=Ruania rhizosphaerae TaxID=1840413 RepID=UPI0013593DFE
MSQWYFSYQGERTGPFEDEQARAQAASNPNGHVWRDGFAEWLPIHSVPELGAAATPPPPPAPNSSSAPGLRRSDEIDFRILGEDMQFVEIELDPGETAIAEAGALMMKDASVRMDTVFGDGSAAEGAGGGFMDKVLSAGKRVVTGESLFTTMFTHEGQGKAHVSFAAPFPGTVLPIKLSDHGGRLICQKDSFLAGARGVSVGIHFQRKVMTGLFGGEGFIMQKLEGDGWVFVHGGGTMVERELGAGERIDVDTGCVMAYHDTVDMDVRPVGGVKSMFFGGEGVFLATLTGPGKVWLQSLPFSRMAGRMLAAAPQTGGRDRGEGSVLGGFGNLLGGDNRF